HLRQDRARPTARADRVAEPGRRRAREDEGGARPGRQAEGDRGERQGGQAAVIVRLMGEGQLRIDDSHVERLNEIDNAAAAALEIGDEAAFRDRLEELHAAVREVGEPLEASDLSASELIVPPVDLSLEEARELFSGEGLIPDLPS